MPVWETSPAGPFDAWPTGGGGFEYFYGFIGGEAHQWYPSLYEGTAPVEPKRTPEEGYHLMEDMTDKAINWIGQQKVLMPDKPFFVYFAPGATHAPHHVPRNGQISTRASSIRAGTSCVKRPSLARKSWASFRRIPNLPRGTKRSRHGTTCLKHSSRCSAGRWRSTPDSWSTPTIMSAGSSSTSRALNLLDDTLVYYIVGDNGGSGEGTLQGTYNEMINFNGASALETPEFLMAHLDKLGGPESYNHFAVGWAHAMNTPYQWTKQVASHWGGTRNGTIVHWPKGIQGKGELRTQFCHCIDIAPTILEVAGLPSRSSSTEYSSIRSKASAWHTRSTMPRRPSSMRRSILRWPATAASTTRAGPRLRVTVRPGSSSARSPAFDDDVWELYDTNKDWTQSNNLAAQMPEKLHELQRLWLIEAVRYNVLPLDDRKAERMNSDIAGRPVLIKGKSQILFGSMGRLSENSVINIKNKSHSVTAEIVVPGTGRLRESSSPRAETSAAGASTPKAES